MALTPLPGVAPVPRGGVAGPRERDGGGDGRGLPAEPGPDARGAADVREGEGGGIEALWHDHALRAVASPPLAAGTGPRFVMVAVWCVVSGGGSGAGPGLPPLQARKVPAPHEEAAGGQAGIRARTQVSNRRQGGGPAAAHVWRRRGERCMPRGMPTRQAGRQGPGSAPRGPHPPTRYSDRHPCTHAAVSP